MRSIKFNMVIMLVLVTFLAAAIIPEASVIAQDTRGLAAPVPKSPHGTILDKTPTYIWTKITGASKYQYQVWIGSTKVLDNYPDSSICEATTCQKTPAVNMGYNMYKWRVRAYKSGSWSAWSAYKYFTVSPPSFESNFSGSAFQWARRGGGDWYFSKSKYLFTEGLAEKWTTAYRTSGQYTNFDYSARMWKDGDGNNVIVFRAGTSVSASNFAWYPGYCFGYTNDGIYIIWFIDDAGTEHILQYWTASAAINQYGWNTLRVVATGDSFWFYINGTYVTKIVDSSRSRGFVGFTSYRSASATANNFFVDWAILTVKETVQ